MALKLIYSANESDKAAKPRAHLDLTQLAILAGVLFFAIKLPMCFVTNNPEELRDFDHFVRIANGQMPYRDFVWLYGPLSPLIYGAVVKIFPTALLTIRLFTLALWSGVAVFTALILARYFENFVLCLAGVFLCTGMVGYPSYSHNHILATLGAVAGVYYLLRYIEKGTDRDLFFSFCGVLICFFTRPVLMGYGVFAGWWALFYFHKHGRENLRNALAFSAMTLFLSLIFLLVYGTGLVSAFFPEPWAVLETKGYPNLHYLKPHFHFSTPTEALDMMRSVRGALETALFYVHYFIWPTFIFTLYGFFPKRATFRAAAVCSLIGWLSSLDLLHYGFTNPMQESAMWVRGQYFFSLTAISFFLVFVPLAVEKKQDWRLKLFSRGALTAVAVWAYLPFLTGVVHLATFPTNSYGFRALSGISTHPDREGVFGAVAFINSLCTEKDAVVIPQYDPGLSRLLKCPDLFANDSYMFTRLPWYPLKPGETPYAVNGGVNNGEAILKQIHDANPRFYLVQGSSPFAASCNEPGWSQKEFGTGANARKVCFRN